MYTVIRLYLERLHPPSACPKSKVGAGHLPRLPGGCPIAPDRLRYFTRAKTQSHWADAKRVQNDAGLEGSWSITWQMLNALLIFTVLMLVPWNGINGTRLLYRYLLAGQEIEKNHKNSTRTNDSTSSKCSLFHQNHLRRRLLSRSTGRAPHRRRKKMRRRTKVCGYLGGWLSH